jgi:hypothetical protein
MASFIDSADPVYGTGADGSVTLDGTTTILGMIPSSNVYSMTSDLYLHNLTINAGVRLAPNGYRIFVKNILTLNNNSTIGYTTGYSTAGSIAQGGAATTAVTHSLGGSATGYSATAPTDALGGSKYYQIPHQAIRGWAVSASSTTPTFLRGGAGGSGQAGGGVVIVAARYLSGPSTGTAYIKAPGTAPAGGGVILIISTHSALPASISTDITGQNPGTVNYMQLV